MSYCYVTQSNVKTLSSISPKGNYRHKSCIDVGIKAFSCLLSFMIQRWFFKNGVTKRNSQTNGKHFQRHGGFWEFWENFKSNQCLVLRLFGLFLLTSFRFFTIGSASNNSSSSLRFLNPVLKQHRRSWTALSTSTAVVWTRRKFRLWPRC